MPNYCENHTSISGDLSELRACHDALLGADGERLLANLLPMPDDVGDGWYEWCRENWGTKWGDFDHWSDDPFEINDHGDGTGYFCSSYMTAWCSFSREFWEKVSARFPSLYFDTTYEEPMMSFAGAVTAKGGVSAETYTEALPSYDDDADDGAQDYCDAMCDLRDKLREQAEQLLEVSR
jgi:hypothetical protein